MALTIQEQLDLGAEIVDKAKSTANVDTGALRRSISVTLVKGVLTFRELYYGQWNNNSKLEEYAKSMIPNGIPWGIQYTTFGGGEYTYTVKKSGRKIGGPPKKKSTGKSSASGSTDRLRNLIATINENKRKAKEARDRRGY